MSITTIALTSHGRKALSTYTQTLRDLLSGLDGDGTADHEHQCT